MSEKIAQEARWALQAYLEIWIDDCIYRKYAKYAFCCEGKYSWGVQLRGILPLLISVQKNGYFIKDSVALAMAVEKIHNAFIITDDLQNGLVARRNQKSFWKKHGSERSYLVSQDILRSAASDLLSLQVGAKDKMSILKAHNRAMEAMVVARIYMEEVKEAEDFEEYIEITREKTGPLFAFIAEASYLIHKDASRMGERAKEAFVIMGVIQQIKEDLALHDLSNNEIFIDENYAKRNIARSIFNSTPLKEDVYKIIRRLEKRVDGLLECELLNI